MEAKLVTDLMAVIIHKPLARRIVPGVDVLTPRGHGMVASVIPCQRVGRGITLPPEIVVELESGHRAMFLPGELNVVETT